MRRLVLISLFFLCIIVYAREKRGVASQLREAYCLAYTGEYTLREVKSVISGIKENDIASESDSTRYFYYYLTAAILDFEERDPDLYDRYLDKALALREKSVGIQSAEYLELLWAKSYSLIEGGRNDEAMKLCQKGLVVGHELVGKDYPAANLWYGELTQLLGELYANKGWHDQAVSLYNESFNILQNSYNEDDPTS